MSKPLLHRPLEAAEVYQFVASTILTMDKRSQPINCSGLVVPEYCANETGMNSSEREEFARLNRGTFPQIANAFVNRLIGAHVIERDWTHSQSYQVWRLNPEKMASLEVLSSLEGFVTSEFVEDLEDVELRTRCESVILRAAPADSLLREAVTVLEDRLRKIVGGASVDRRDLPAKVLHPTSGKLSVYVERDRQEDLFYLVRGLLGLYGTEVHHRLQNLSPKLVRTVVAMIDQILQVFDSAENSRIS